MRAEWWFLTVMQTHCRASCVFSAHYLHQRLMAFHPCHLLLHDEVAAFIEMSFVTFESLSAVPLYCTKHVAMVTFSPHLSLCPLISCMRKTTSSALATQF